MRTIAIEPKVNVNDILRFVQKTVVRGANANETKYPYLGPDAILPALPNQNKIDVYLNPTEPIEMAAKASKTVGQEINFLF